MSGRTGTRLARVLLAVKAGQQTFRVDLCRATGLDWQAVTGCLQILEQQNLVTTNGRTYTLASGAHVAKARAEARELLAAREAAA